MRDLSLRKWLSILNHSVIFGVVLSKVLEANSFFCQYLKSGNLQLIINKNWGHFLQIFPRYLIASLKPLNSKVKFIRIHYWLSKIAARLFIESQTTTKIIQHTAMGRIFFWVTQGSIFKAFFVQHLFMRFVLHYDSDFAIYADDNTPCVIRKNMQDAIFKL